MKGATCEGEGKYDLLFMLDNAVNGYGEHDFTIIATQNTGIIQFGSIMRLKDIVYFSEEGRNSYMVVSDGGNSLLRGFLRRVDITLYINQSA